MDERNQSYYYQQAMKKKKKQPPWRVFRYLHRFAYQYPKSTIAGMVFGTFALVYAPVFNLIYVWATMSPEEFKKYQKNEWRLAKQRAMHGIGWKIPFTSKTIDFYTPEEAYLSELQNVQKRKLMKKSADDLADYLGIERGPGDIAEDDDDQ